MPGPLALPFIGAALPLLTSKRPSDVLVAWTAKHGPCVRVGMPGGKRVVLVTSPALIAEASSLPPAAPCPSAALTGGSGGPLPKAAHAALAASLGSAEAASACGSFGATLESAQRLVAALVGAGPNAAVDVADGLDRLALDAAVKGAFGLEAGGLAADAGGRNVAKEGFGACPLLRDLRAGVAGLGPLAGLGCPASGAAAAAAPLQGHWKVMAAALAARGPPGADDKSVGAALVRAAAAGGLGEGADLAATLAAVVVASTLPTSRAAAWALYDLYAEPAVQDKVARELGEAALLAHGEDRAPRLMTEADVAGRLPYLGAVVRESLRVHAVGAPGPGLAGAVRRAGPAGAALGGFHLPPGTLVAAPPAAVHAAPANYAAPARFSPDRWLEPVKAHTPKAVTEQPGPVLLVGKPKAHGGAPGAFVPFGSGGASACPAEGAALLHVTALVATLVSNFRMRLDDAMGGRKGVSAACVEDAAGARLGAGLKMVFVPRASIGFSADV